MKKINIKKEYTTPNVEVVEILTANLIAASYPEVPYENGEGDGEEDLADGME